MIVSLTLLQNLIAPTDASGFETPATRAATGIRFKEFLDGFVPACMRAGKDSFERFPERCEYRDLILTLEDGSVIRPSETDIVVAKSARDLAGFCNKRGQYAYLATVAGVATREVVVIEGLPRQCKGRFVLYERLSSTIENSEFDESTSLEIAAKALDLVRRFHQAGFVHGIYGLDAFAFDQEIGDVRLGKLAGVQGIYLADGETLSSVSKWVKEDALKFYDEVLTHLVRRQDVLDAMLEAIETSSETLGRGFDYLKWIGILQALRAGHDIELPEITRGHVAVADTTLVSGYLDLYNTCQAGLPEEIPSCDAWEGCVCPPLEMFEVATIGKVGAENAKGDFEGQYGFVHRLTSPNVLLKVNSKQKERHVLCAEKSILTALNGFRGIVPRLYQIVEGVHEVCHMQAFVMEKFGDEGILMENVWSVRDPFFFRILASLIEAVKALHEQGFIHGDLHPDNFKLDSLDGVEDGLRLIDFGLARAYVDANGVHSLNPEESRRVDMARIATEVMGAPGTSSNASLVEFMAEMSSLKREERPDYEKWITFFRSL
jgi:hypothetical protein